jgi:DNA-binding transcriptional ArsR family regulator
MTAKKESFVLLSLKEDKAKELAQIVSNDTCRRILDFLSEHEATESEIAKSLKMPISTVHYNLQQLMKGKLVLSEEYHYSQKGKEINHYKLANKIIIIAPQSTWGLKEKLKKAFPISIIIILGTGIIELARRLFASSASIMSNTFEGAGSLMKAAPMAAEMDQAVEPLITSATNAIPEAITTTAQNLTDTGTTEIVIQTFPIWQQAALWFFIGGAIAIIAYIVVDYIRNK